MEEENRIISPENTTDQEVSSVPENNETDKRPGPHISYIVGAICALLVAGAAGAAIMADRIFMQDDGIKIYSSASSTAAEMSGESPAEKQGGKSVKDDLTAGKDEFSETAGTKKKPAAESTKKTSSDTGKDSGEGKASTTTSAKTARSSAVPAAATAEPAGVPEETSTVFDYPADINSATYECMINVSGINRTAADGIVSYRRKNGKIHNFEELLDVYGIGERTLSVIREYFYISETDFREASSASEKVPEESVTPQSSALPDVTVPAKQTEPEQASASEAETSPNENEVSEAEETLPPEETAPAAEATGKADEDLSLMPPEEARSREDVEDQVRREVNINEADAQELSDALMIDPELAEKVVEFRTNIGMFVNDLELLYVDGFSEKLLVELRPYIKL